MKNRTKEKLRAGKPALGVGLSMMHPDAIRTVSNAGFDWVLYDIEHGPWGIETLNEVIGQTCPSLATPIIRVVWDDRNAIKRALDTGAYGIIVPWVTTREMAEEAVRYSRYPPQGLRGCGPGRAARAWGITTEEYIEVANDEVLVAVQIEREEAVDAIEDIVSVEGLDATWIGPADLSLSMGVKVGEAFSDPKVLGAMGKVIDTCNDAGVSPGIASGGDPERIHALIEQGFRFITVQSDMGFLSLGCKEYLDGLGRLMVPG
jgi:2-keto-3-deoxy-L-rhamnonate aldolase RhmA